MARIRAGLQDRLYLGNLDAVRDWGYAPEYVEAMWRMLQRDEPDDYVIATGVPASVRDFLQAAFEAAEFLMDYLKTDAPFWKQETGPKGMHWVEAKDEDDKARARWE